MEKKNKNGLHLTIGKAVLVCLSISVLFVIYRLIQSPTVATGDVANLKIKSDYVLTLLQCLLGIAALILPRFLYQKATIQLPDSFLIMYFLFLFCAIYLGEVRSFYYRVPHWDTILHTFSGVMLGSLGFSVVMLLNDSEKVLVHLSPLFIAIFAFCFAVSLGVVWEIYEYVMDGILGLNMQKFMLEDGTALVGQEALADTMKDLAVDSIGAFATSLIGFVMMKKKPEWLHRFDIKQNA